MLSAITHVSRLPPPCELFTISDEQLAEESLRMNGHAKYPPPQGFVGINLDRLKSEGPIRLNLLGLIVRTNTIHLSITAQPGPGNLLGNLLCDIAHLLDDNDLANVTNDLNTLLTLL